MNWKKSTLFFIIFISISNAFPTERITQYHTDIVIHKDGQLTVTETITVKALGISIINGIYRDFPTHYRPHFLRTIVPFEVVSIKRDGHALSKHDTIDLPRGVRVYMRDGGRLKVPGTYTFELVYKTSRQIGFFDNSDELYFNVVGADWEFPIDKVTATVHLPEDLTVYDVQTVAYSGDQGSYNKKYEILYQDSNALQFVSTVALKRHQAFSVVIGMPKGTITPPSTVQYYKWLLIDNFDLILLLLIPFLLLNFIIIGYLLRKSREPVSQIIPLFEPPKNFTPAMVRYFKKRSVDSVALAADIVNMAVHGWLQIDCEEKWWNKEYTLRLTSRTPDKYYYSNLKQKLFGGSKSLHIAKGKNYTKISDTFSFLKTDCERTVKKNYLKDGYVKVILMTLFFMVLSPFIIVISIDKTVFLVQELLLIGLIYLYYRLNLTYTQEGFALRDQIEGFKLYLATAEIEQIELVGTPPTKTPELYEKFLPYAIALGVERQWSKQFVPLFEQLDREGKEYHCCRWYHGRGSFRASQFDSLRSFSTSIGSSLSSTINVSAPGSRSGFGGGAGGGGGGGGGGGC